MGDAATIPVGWRVGEQAHGELRLPITTARRNILVTGTSGWGKSGFLLGYALGLLTTRRDTKITLIDGKGESAGELVEHFLPALASRCPHLAAAEITVVKPFGRYGVKLNPLAKVPGLAPEVQANLVCGLFDGLLDGGLGPRMTSVLSQLIRVVMALGGTLLDILALVRDPGIAPAIAPRLAEEELRQYLLQTLPREPEASLGALRARLEWLLLIPEIRAMLCSDGVTSGSAILESTLAVIDLGDAPQGFVPLARFIGSWLLAILTAGIFSRQPSESHVTVITDEWQELVRTPGGAAELERCLSQARFRKTNFVLANQTLGQISAVSSELVRSLLTNISVHVAFRPGLEDVRHLLPLLPATGRLVDPSCPDQLLSADAERKLLLDRLQRLPPRHALLGDLVAGRAEIIRTLDVPYAEARRRAERVPSALRERYRQGRYGLPFGELMAKVRPMVETVTKPPAAEGHNGRQPARGGRPPLVLP